VDGCAINVQVDGRKDVPSLMLSNSMGCSLEMWQPQMTALTEQFHVIRYDRRGHGKSAASNAGYSVERFGKDAIAILDHLGVERTRIAARRALQGKAHMAQRTWRLRHQCSRC